MLLIADDSVAWNVSNGFESLVIAVKFSPSHVITKYTKFGGGMFLILADSVADDSFDDVLLRRFCLYYV